MNTPDLNSVIPFGTDHAYIDEWIFFELFYWKGMSENHPAQAWIEFVSPPARSLASLSLIRLPSDGQLRRPPGASPRSTAFPTHDATPCRHRIRTPIQMLGRKLASQVEGLAETITLPRRTITATSQHHHRRCDPSFRPAVDLPSRLLYQAPSGNYAIRSHVERRSGFEPYGSRIIPRELRDRARSSDGGTHEALR